ncbi:MAG: DUF4157 domain-containing protein [Myxococcales bacterium]|nr:DUF4157 domain-containing protein [Myxococcales bacterium]
MTGESDDEQAPAHRRAGVVQRRAIADVRLYLGSADAPVQRRADGDAAIEADVRGQAERGVAGPGTALPHAETIQQAFGGHDLSGVRAHTDAAAATSAGAIGASAYATGNDVAFASPSPDLHTAAHEAAHVVQQRAGVSLYGGIGQTGDRYEQHADAVADAVVAGKPAAPLLDQLAAPAPSAAAPAVQRFSAGEHRDMGNGGSGSHKVKLADDYELPYGEMTALGGDHFESIQQMRTFAAKPSGKESREEIEYAREWKLGVKGLKYSEEAKREQIKRYYALASNNAVHFLNPNDGDKSKTAAEKGQDLDGDKKSGWWPKGKPKNAVAAYRHNHVMAINEALLAGKAGKPMDSALATDGFASHFLTDSFSGGHVRTERNPIPAYWNDKVPLFYTNFVAYLSQEIARAMNNMGGYNILTEDALTNGPLFGAMDGAQQVVSAKVGAKGVVNFGDIVALALHDYDNAKGVSANVDGKKVKLMGDGHAGEGDEKALAIRAVGASVCDVEQAWTAGKAGRDSVDELVGEDGLFEGERLMPTFDGSPDKDNPGMNWRLGSPRELLTIPYFRKALFTFCQEKKTDLEEVGADLGGAKEKALKKAIISRLETEDGCVGLIWGVLNYTPDTGGGIFGNNQDDNANAYYEHAAKIPGGIQSLTRQARRDLILNMTAGFKTWKDEEWHVWYVLDLAPEPDARWVIDQVGWGKLADELEDSLDDKFRKKFPKSEYGHPK